VKPPPFAYAAPETLASAIALLKDGARPLSGGQSLMPVLNFRLAAPSLLVDLRKIPGLDRIDINDTGVRLGARVLWRDIEQDKRLAMSHPLLQAAIAQVAHYQVRNRGTVGGSLAHADPASEMPGIAVTCDAEIELHGPAGARAVKAAEFFLGPLTTILAENELIVGIRLPAWPASRRWGFEEFARRKGDFALAGVMLFWDPDAGGRARDVHIGIIAACSRPMRLPSAEALLEGQTIDAGVIAAVARAAAAASDPGDDLHGSAAYRRSLVGTLVTRCLARAVSV
jgi:carbon-monoxide dehydrogenase medium subunit